MSRIVCGWYTPDYAHWAKGLADSCDRFGEAHDLLAVNKANKSWEAETQRKPFMVLDALNKHSDKHLIVFLDVDAVLLKPLDELQQALRGDVGMYCVSRLRTRRQLFFRSGTLALTPNQHTRKFIEAWCEHARSSGHGTVDQESLINAVEAATSAAIQALSVTYCATKGDLKQGIVKLEEVAILHEQASFASTQKESWFSKRRRRLVAGIRGTSNQLGE